MDRDFVEDDLCDGHSFGCSHTPRRFDTARHPLYAHRERPLPTRVRYYTPRLTAQALGSSSMERGYYQCWSGLKSHFTGAKQVGADKAVKPPALSEAAAA